MHRDRYEAVNSVYGAYRLPTFRNSRVFGCVFKVRILPSKLGLVYIENPSDHVTSENAWLYSLCARLLFCPSNLEILFFIIKVNILIETGFTDTIDVEPTIARFAPHRSR